MLWAFHERHPEVFHFDGIINETVPHGEHTENCRIWSEIKYLSMSKMRNNILDLATAMQDKFDYLFSLDSDILLKDPETINKLLAYSELYPDTVISPLSYMSPYNKEHPSIMSWLVQPGMRAGRPLDNYPIGEPFIADIVMAAVLMPKSVFTKVRYRGHRQGEDLGFAYDLWRNGFRSLAASDIECPHVMYPSMLDSHAKSWLDVDVS